MKQLNWLLTSLCTTLFCSTIADTTAFPEDFIESATAQTSQPPSPYSRQGYKTAGRFFGPTPPEKRDPSVAEYRSPQYYSEPPPARISLRHIEPKGIGYRQGYTTIAGFFTPFWSGSIGHWVPFMDLRAHVFDNNKFAANAGLGLRYCGSWRVWGINAYYDFRQTSRRNYNQVAAGIESLGKVWDLRVNAYLPLWKTTTSLYNTQFQKFKGHFLYLRSSKQFAMKGGNGEIGFHLSPLYFAGGPYYLIGEGKSTWGGQLRGSIDLLGNWIRTEGVKSLNQGCIRLEGNISYDRIFKLIGQGQISFNIALGGRQESQNRRASARSERLMARALQGVDRMEIIPISQKHTSAKAINPITGAPYFFWFVDNTSSSAGTYEDPFSSLVDAQNASSPNDVIYVFPGDGTTTHMAAGMTLKADQRFWGSGVGHNLPTQFGGITVPALTTTSPTMTSGGNGITLAYGNEVSGFVIDSPGSNGISGINVGGMTILHTTITDAVGVGILLTPSSGDINLNMQYLDINGGAHEAIKLTATGGINATMVVANSSLTGNGTQGISINTSTMTNFNQTIANNTISGNSSDGIAMFSNTITTTNQTITNNAISNNAGSGINIHNLGTMGTLNQNISHNLISHNAGYGMNYAFGTYDTLNATMTNNTVINNTGQAGIYFALASVTNLNVSISNSTVSGNGTTGTNSSGIILGTTNNAVINIANCTVSNNHGLAASGYGNGISIGANPTRVSISNCKIMNNDNDGIRLNIGSLPSPNQTIITTIKGNTILNNGSTTGFHTLFSAAATMCIDLEHNTSNTGYFLDNSVGTIQLAPLNVHSINVGTITSSSAITPQASCQ